MRGRLIWVGVMLGWLIGAYGCATFDQRSQQELASVYGPHKPSIERFYASAEIAPLETWKIYIKGGDRDGDMRFIDVWPDVPGGPAEPMRIMISSDQAKKISGYLLLNTRDFNADWEDMPEGWVRLLISLEDRVGHVSEPAELKTCFSGGAGQAPPPKGVFEERFLGYITADGLPFRDVGQGPPFP